MLQQPTGDTRPISGRPVSPSRLSVSLPEGRLSAGAAVIPVFSGTPLLFCCLCNSSPISVCRPFRRFLSGPAIRRPGPPPVKLLVRGRKARTFIQGDIRWQNGKRNNGILRTGSRCLKPACGISMHARCISALCWAALPATSRKKKRNPENGLVRAFWHPKYSPTRQLSRRISQTVFPSLGRVMLESPPFSALNPSAAIRFLRFCSFRRVLSGTGIVHRRAAAVKLFVLVIMHSIIADEKGRENTKVLPGRMDFWPPHGRDAHTRCPHERICCLHSRRGGKTQEIIPMVSTKYGETPWSTGELAALHKLNGAGAKRKQEELDAFVSEILAPHFVARGVRADQAAASIQAIAGRLARLFASGDSRVAGHITRLIRQVYDRWAGKRLLDAAKRLPAFSGIGAGASSKVKSFPEKSLKRRIA